ncbi:MAG: acyltransferase family protein [Candidatus Omnitrophota bacterium]
MDPASANPLTEPREENLLWVDLLRVIATWCVILIHVAADVITEWHVLPKDWWWTANVYDSLARGAVAVFIMLSGALLLPKTESYRDFFRKRFDKILIPFLAWSLFYLLWRKHFYEPGLGPAEMLSRFASDKVYFHLWFLYILTGLYLLTPVIRVWVAHASERDLIYFLALCFAVSFCLPFAETLSGLLGGPEFHIPLPAGLLTGFTGYFVLGYFIRKYVPERAVPAARIFWFVSFWVCLFGTAWVCRRSASFSPLFYENMAPNTAVYAASFFILMKHASPTLEKWIAGGGRHAVVLVAKASFGIYLIHPVFIDILTRGRWGFMLRSNTSQPVFMIPFVAAVVYLLSLATVLLIQKIPFLRRTV